MRKFFLFCICSTAFLLGLAQPTKKPVKKESAPAQSQMDKAMEEAMKGMSEEEKAEMRKMMGAIMPALQDQNNKTASYPDFTTNAQLVPVKDVAKIRAASAKKLTQAEISSFAANLYNKIMAKGDAAEIALVKKVIAQSPKANDLGKAAIVCMMQGYPQAAMALSMKAVTADPANANWQNNMASLLTQYGCPEQALPVLKKLKDQFPGNSTILNNLAYAWLGLGVTDSAKIFAGYAARANPQHPEAALCGGLMQELNGDPVKAGDAYVEAMENALNPFTEQVMKNNKGGQQAGKIDFDKIKRTIPIYEYFPKNWIPTSLLSPSTNDYVKNDSLQKSYAIMDEKLDREIEALSDAASHELEVTAEKGEEAFVNEMAGEMIAGLNFMSRTAVTVMIVLHQYGAELMDRQAKESIELANKIEEHRKAYDKATKNASKCEVYDTAANRFMKAVNPMIFNFYRKQAEDYRQWLNALATWNWYVVGNPKNIVIAQDLGYAAWLESLYISAMTQQIVYAPTCKSLKEVEPLGIPAPAIPNFACPAIVSIPVGADWQQLSKATKNFNENSIGATQSGKHPMPNMSIAYGIGNNMIAQPGKAPFVKTANGSVSPGMMGTDDELTPLSKIPDDLTPLPDLRKGRIAKQLLKSMMTADCKNVNKYKYKLPELIVTIGEVEFEKQFDVEIGEIIMYQDLGKKIKDMKREGELNVLTYEDGSMAVFNRDGDLQFELGAPLDKQTHEISREAFGEKLIIRPKPATDATSKNGVYSELKDTVKQLNTNGLQPTLSSGLQVPGIFKTIAGLFQ